MLLLVLKMLGVVLRRVVENSIFLLDTSGREEWLSRKLAVLPSCVRERIEKVPLERERATRIAAHYALQEGLRNLLSIGPAEYSFAYDRFGKPSVFLQNGRRVWISLSHTDRLGMCVINLKRPVGIDSESVAETPANYQELAVRFFQAEEAADIAAAGCSAQVRFLSYWTAKEAALKVIGHGLNWLPRSLCHFTKSNSSSSIVVRFANRSQFYLGKTFQWGSTVISVVVAEAFEPTIRVYEIPLP